MRIRDLALRSSVTMVFLAVAGGASPATRPATQPADGGPSTVEGHLPELRLRAVPLSDAIQAVRDHCRVRIDVDWTALQAIGVKRDAPVTARLRDLKVSKALQLICKSVVGEDRDDDHSVYVIPGDDDRSVLLTTLAVLKSTAVDRDYPVGDLVAPADRGPPHLDPPDSPLGTSIDQAKEGGRFEELIEDVQGNVDPNSWKDAGGEIGEVRIDEKHSALHIHQTPGNQRKIEVVLSMLREKNRPTTGPAASGRSGTQPASPAGASVKP